MGNEILNIVYEELAAASFSLYTARFFSDAFVSLANTSSLDTGALTEQIRKLDEQISRRVLDTYHISFFRTNSGICFVPEEPAPESTL